MTECQHYTTTPAYDQHNDIVGSVELCTWGETHPASADKLIDAPRWLQRMALSGCMLRPGDCDGCPCKEAPTPPAHGDE